MGGGGGGGIEILRGGACGVVSTLIQTSNNAASTIVGKGMAFQP